MTLNYIYRYISPDVTGFSDQVSFYHNLPSRLVLICTVKPDSTGYLNILENVSLYDIYVTIYMNNMGGS